MTEKNEAPAVIAVDSRGFVSADGVCVGRLTSDGESIVVVDKDKRRSQIRGSRYVHIPIRELTQLAQSK